jgi:serine/threonine protein kinase/tetratricopeptide (TPR) repeat protein
MTQRDADPPTDPPTESAGTDAPAPAVEELLARVADDFSSRFRRGERPRAEEYAEKHPELAVQIRQMLAAIALIEESRPFDAQAAGEVPGTLLGPYKLLERIGEGGFGVVFMAEQQFPVRRRVAVKLIKAGLDTKQVIARFEAERQALAMMDHPNIAKVHDAGATESGRPYFVMELVPGVPVTEYCDRERLTPRERLKLFVQVCHAVQHAHTKGIIHRDLKPTNVLVAIHDDVAVPKVIDFGVAKATGERPLTDRTLFTQFAQMVGTPLYMSPEQAQPGGIDVDTRSDVYSLGALLYELLTGTTPFDGKRLRDAAADEVRRIIREEEPPRPSTRLSTSATLSAIAASRGLEPRKLGGLICGELDWIVMKAIEKDRARRYETAIGLATDVQRYLTDQPVQAGPPSAGYRLRKFVRRNRGPVLAGALVLAALLGGIAVSTWQAVRANREAANARAEVGRQEATNKFLNDMLNAANTGVIRPGGELARADVTVPQAMDAALQRLDAGSLKGQPEIEAAVRGTIGEAYHVLGQTGMYPAQCRIALRLSEEAYGPEHPKLAHATVSYGWALICAGRSREAEPIMARGLAMQRKLLKADDTELMETMSRTCRMLIDLGKFAEAERLARDAVDLDRRRSPTGESSLADPLTRVALALAEQGKLAEAQQWHEQSINVSRKQAGEKHPQTTLAMARLADVYERQGKVLMGAGQVAEAAALFRNQYAVRSEQAGATSADALAALKLLTGALRSQGNSAEADALDQEMRAAQQKHAADTLAAARDDPHMALGNLLKSQGELAAADAAYADAIRVRPGMAEAWAGRGACRLMTGDFVGAAEYYSEAIRFDPGNFWYWHERGYAHLSLGKHQKSIEDHSKVIELRDGPGVRFRRGQSYEALGEFDSAEADYSKAIQVQPGVAEYRHGRARLYLRSGQPVKAQADFGELLKCAEGNPFAQNTFAWQLATDPEPRLRQPKVAVALAQKAIAAEPRAAAFWNTLGTALYRDGRWNDAVGALRRSMELGDGGTSFDFLFTAMAQERAGDSRAARYWYDKTVLTMQGLSPANPELSRFRAEADELFGHVRAAPETRRANPTPATAALRQAPPAVTQPASP